MLSASHGAFSCVRVLQTQKKQKRQNESKPHVRADLRRESSNNFRAVENAHARFGIIAHMFLGHKRSDKRENANAESKASSSARKVRARTFIQQVLQFLKHDIAARKSAYDEFAHLTVYKTLPKHSVGRLESFASVHPRVPPLRQTH